MFQDSLKALSVLSYEQFDWLQFKANLYSTNRFLWNWILIQSWLEHKTNFSQSAVLLETDLKIHKFQSLWLIKIDQSNIDTDQTWPIKYRHWLNLTNQVMTLVCFQNESCLKIPSSITNKWYTCIYKCIYYEQDLPQLMNINIMHKYSCCYYMYK